MEGWGRGQQGLHVSLRGTACRHHIWGQDSGMWDEDGWDKRAFFSSSWKERVMARSQQVIESLHSCLRKQEQPENGSSIGMREGWPWTGKNCVCVFVWMCIFCLGETLSGRADEVGQVGRCCLDYVRYQIRSCGGIKALQCLKERAIWYTHITVGLTTEMWCEWRQQNRDGERKTLDTCTYFVHPYVSMYLYEPLTLCLCICVQSEGLWEGNLQVRRP